MVAVFVEEEPGALLDPSGFLQLHFAKETNAPSSERIVGINAGESIRTINKNLHYVRKIAIHNMENSRVTLNQL